MICSEHYYPNWSSRGIRAVDCTKPAKKILYDRFQNYHRPLCGVHAKVYERQNNPNWIVEDLP